MRRILLDVDTQVDFMSPAGALHVPASAATQAMIRETLIRAEDPDGGYAAIIGSVDSHAYDAWEFECNGGPFPTHCVKGQRGWCRTFDSLPARQRFIPMGVVRDGQIALSVGERRQGAGPRVLDAAMLAGEALDGVGLYFEKEVYSLFSNGLAAAVLEVLVARLGGAAEVMFDVIGYCTGGYCVDAAVEGLRARGYQVTVLAGACAAIGGDEGMETSRVNLREQGALWSDEVSVAE